ncbi:MAG: heavy-metal-associated domain-containing protein [Fimbriimonadaceae bacterium]|nr:heavy-metal-associated domain-containing protein [Fimbriimonadaceae bacterium]
MPTTLYNVTGMSCQNCVRHVREAIAALPGVLSVEVDLASGSARVEHTELDDAALIAALEDEGYGATRQS